MRPKTMLLLSTTALAVLAAAAPTPADAAAKRVSCGKLPAGVTSRSVQCALVSVPARHGARTDVRYRVAVSVVKARRRTRARPLVILGGGPGQAIAEAGPQVASPKARNSFYGRLGAVRDLVFVDQRGAGASRPRLACDRELEAAAAPADDASYVAQSVKTYAACAARLRGGGIDLSTFTTSQIAGDVRQVVADLGLGRVDVIATSHGTKVALLAAARDDRWIGRLVLSSAIDPQRNFIQDAPASFDRALDAVIADCARAKGCARRFPGLAPRLESAITGLEARPLGRGPSAITAGAASAALFTAFYAEDGPAGIPKMIAQLAARDPKLLRGGANATPDDLGITTGQYFAVTCAEEIAGLDAARQLADATALGAAPRVLTATNIQVGPAAKEVCAGFGVPASPARPADLAKIDVPTLVITGEYDQITPPAYGETVARGIRQAQLVQVAGAGHSPESTGGRCGYVAVQRFLSSLPRKRTC